MRTFYWIRCKTCPESRMLITDFKESSVGYALEREKLKADFVLHHMVECREKSSASRLGEYV